MESADVLEQAADLLESGRVPWNQYGVMPNEAWVENDGGACAMEVMRLAAAGKSKDVYYQARSYLSRHLVQVHGWVQGIGLWNDVKGRTLDEVVDAMKETAKGLRNAAC